MTSSQLNEVTSVVLVLGFSLALKSVLSLLNEMKKYFNVKRWDLLRHRVPDTVRDELSKEGWNMKP